MNVVDNFNTNLKKLMAERDVLDAQRDAQAKK